MIPSSPLNHHSCPWLPKYFFFILLLHLLYTTPGGAVRMQFIIENKCSESIWPMVFENDTKQSFDYSLPIGSSVVVMKPSYWSGRMWAKTGCTFNDSGTSSCLTGDMGPYTTAEFGSDDFYYVNLADGYNLPLVVKPVGGTGSECDSAGCVHDLNCPEELTVQGGACKSAPTAPASQPPELNRPVNPRSSSTEGSISTGGFPPDPDQKPVTYPKSVPSPPSKYYEMFKKACPKAYSDFAYDNPSTIFRCTGAIGYNITFCPPYGFLLGSTPAPAPAPAPSPTSLPAPVPAPPPAPAPSFIYPPETINDNSQKTKKGNIRAKGIIKIVSTVSISVLIIIAITISYFLKKHHFQMGSKRKNKRDVEINLVLQHGYLAPKRYKYSEIKKMTKSLTDKLGQGGFGSVYRGTLPDGRLVAVKILREIDSNGEEFINEVASISRTSHVNIVSLLGFCYEGNKSALVYEYMPNKSLDKFLSNSVGSDSFIDNKKLYEIAVGIAKGLEYLHTGCTTRIVHFDIKPQNILLDDDLIPKISDFGLAKLCKKKQSALSMSGTRGTAGYIAPEVFWRNFGAVSHKSDVYSYGMLLLEIAGTKNTGIQVIQMQSSENYFPDKIYEQVRIDVSNLDESMPNEEGEEDERRRKMKMMLIGFCCIQTNPSERPSMSKVVEMFEGSVESIKIPPKPVLTSTVIPHQQTSSSSYSASGLD